MGWNNADIISKSDPLFQELEQQPRFYFLHSYFFECRNNNNIIAETEYGLRFTSAVRLDNIYEYNFIPKKVILTE